MRLAKIAEEFKQALAPYLFFWEEWITNENCNLNKNDVEKINAYLALDFKVSLMEEIFKYKEAEIIKEIIKKLNMGYPVFKDVVIVDFLLSIFKMAKQYGYDQFMQTPIKLLKIEERLKETLLNFEKITVQQIFFAYQPEHFSQAWIYKHIVQFQTYQLKQQKLIHQ